MPIETTGIDLANVAAPLVIATPKPGYKTSEFWMTLASQLVAAFLAAGIVPDTHVAVKVAAFVAAALSSLGYTVARASAKKPAP
jgi:hypothetical protein